VGQRRSAVVAQWTKLGIDVQKVAVTGSRSNSTAHRIANDVVVDVECGSALIIEDVVAGYEMF